MAKVDENRMKLVMILVSTSRKLNILMKKKVVFNFKTSTQNLRKSLIVMIFDVVMMLRRFDSIILMFQKRIVVSKVVVLWCNKQTIVRVVCQMQHLLTWHIFSNHCGFSLCFYCDYLCVESISSTLVASWCIKFYYNYELEIPSFINNLIKNDWGVVELALLAFLT